MRANQSYLMELLKPEKTRFFIPVFQRNYDWNTDHCHQLFSDLETIAATQRDHFIGSIVYVSMGTATEPNYSIIDGQQRITSVMLLLKALYDLTEDVSLKGKIPQSYLVNSEEDDDVKVKLKQVESDGAIFEKLILHEFREEDYTTAEKESKIYRNYQFFRKRVPESDMTIAQLFSALAKLEIIDVELTTEDPQEVFESMNSTGKDLTNTDLLRNYLLMALNERTQKRFYKMYWAKIQKNVGSKMMELYMTHYLIMKRKSDSINIHRKSSKINRTNLYDCYRLYYPPEQKNMMETENLLKDMYRYSSVYRKIVNNDKLTTDLDKAIDELIHELNAEQAAIFIMYLLDYQKQNGIADREMMDAVQACISYVFRMRMFKENASSQFFALAIQNFEHCDDSDSFVDRVWIALTSGLGRYRFPRDIEFKNAFKTKDMYLEFKPPFIRYILYKFERSRTREIVDPQSATIEHILPRDTRKWAAHLASISDTDYQEYIHKIGNLTLTKMNSEMSNNPFGEKKEVYKTSNYTITRELAEIADWNSDEIEKRCDQMANEALKIWSLPREYNQETVSDSFFNMDEDTEKLLETVRSKILAHDTAIKEVRKKYYINYKKGRRNLTSIVPRKNYLSAVLSAKREELHPNEMLEDVSYKGHLGNGDTMMRIDSEDDTNQLLEYLKQMAQGLRPGEDAIKSCLDRVSKHVGSELKKIARRAYRTLDGKTGFVFCTSKSYGQDNRKRYWYAYRRELLSKIDTCEKRYVVYSCAGIEEVLIVPVEMIESNIDHLNYSTDPQGNPKYWHVVLFRDRDNRITMQLPKSTLNEIDMMQYIV